MADTRLLPGRTWDMSTCPQGTQRHRTHRSQGLTQAGADKAHQPTLCQLIGRRLAFQKPAQDASRSTWPSRCSSPTLQARSSVNLPARSCLADGPAVCVRDACLGISHHDQDVVARPRTGVPFSKPGCSRAMRVGDLTQRSKRAAMQCLVIDLKSIRAGQPAETEKLLQGLRFPTRTSKQSQQWCRA